MPNFTDHLGRVIELQNAPQRIISLCPSQTETLFTLGAGQRVVGRTKWCIHPDEIKNVKIVGGTKAIALDEVRALQPDLIIGEKEENTPEMIGELEKEFPVFITDVKDLESCLKMIQDLGKITFLEKEGMDLADNVKKTIASIPAEGNKRRVIYLIWRKPWMAAGGDTFIDAMLELAGFENSSKEKSGRYPILEKEDLIFLNPEYVFLSSEPFPFSSKHVNEIMTLVPLSKVLLVDGELFSWYGSSVLEAPRKFNLLFEQLMKDAGTRA